MPTRVTSDERYAILAIDPGGTSGVAAGYIRGAPTVKEALQDIEKLKTAEVGGSWLEQSASLASIMAKFVYRANVEQQISLDNIHIVIEDFVLRRTREGGATGNLTSCWVAAGAVALYTAHPLRELDGEYTLRGFELWDSSYVSWCQAAKAKGYATNARLKIWGLYERGESDHERDAKRHLATKANELL